MRDARLHAAARARAFRGARLCALYDPHYSSLGGLLGELRATYGYALLPDAHTGSPRAG
jgi:N-formylglutamate amidohydrolase